jgi:purine-binding chemotaxis protein CheW
MMGKAVDDSANNDDLDIFSIDGTEDSADAEMELDEHLVRLVCFRFGHEEYAIRVEMIEEIIPVPKPLRLPRPKPGVQGLFNLRGTIIPLLDIRTMLGFPAVPETDKSRVLILRAKGKLSGLFCETVQDIRSVAPEIMEEAPTTISTSKREFIDKVVRTGDSITIILDVNVLMNRTILHTDGTP